jgi:hypothetical protein
MNPVLADILSSGTVQSADGSHRMAHGRKSEDVGHLLQRVVREQKPLPRLLLKNRYGPR